MKQLKFIVLEGDLNSKFRVGIVEFHSDLLSIKERSGKTRILGGGHINIDYDRNLIIFTGRSYDFGQVENLLEEVKNNIDFLKKIIPRVLRFSKFNSDISQFNLAVRDDSGVTTVLR